MAVTMKAWQGANAHVKIGAAVSGTPGTSGTDLWTQASGTDFTNECKDLTINPGGHEVSVVNTYGDQFVEEGRPGMVTADFTMVLTDVDIFGLSFGSAATAPSGFVRYQGSDSTGARTLRAIAFRGSSSTKGTLNILMNNAYITAQGEITLGAEGTGEQSISAACLLSDYYVESG